MKWAKTVESIVQGDEKPNCGKSATHRQVPTFRLSMMGVLVVVMSLQRHSRSRANHSILNPI